MNKEEKLPIDLTFEPDGHVSDVALSILGDGEEELLDYTAITHVERCEACAVRLGAAAMMSLRVGEELPALAARFAAEEARREAPAPMLLMAEARPVKVASPIKVFEAPPRPLPIRAIAAALLVAAIGAVPSLMVELPRLPELMASIIRVLPILGRTVFTILRGAAGGTLGVAPALSWLSAGIFLITGLALARTMSRRRSLQGGIG